jgi:Flp pilus assembly protein TadG
MNARAQGPGQHEGRLKRGMQPCKREGRHDSGRACSHACGREDGRGCEPQYGHAKRLAKAAWAAPAWRSQRGIAAIEFALVFPLFFVIFYSIVTYGLIFAVNQTLSLAAQEGGRAALRYEGETSLSSAYTLRTSAACTTAQGLVAWIPQAQASCSNQACTGGMQCVTVQMTYNYAAHPLVPTLPMMGFVTPSTLGAQVVVQLDPASIQANM